MVPHECTITSLLGRRLGIKGPIGHYMYKRRSGMICTYTRTLHSKDTLHRTRRHLPLLILVRQSALHHASSTKQPD